MQNNEVFESKKSEILRITMSWLKENYEHCEGVSIPRKTLYENYLLYCSQLNLDPISSATFGKIIRQQFPQISTRRLGIRGQSKYHYHGLAVKVTSRDFNPEFSRTVCIDKGLSIITSLHPKNRSEPFPIISISIPHYEDISEVKIKSDFTHFLVMYQTHSQQLLNSIIQGSFKEVEGFLSSFWKGCPNNFRYLFDNARLISCVLYLDIQVYLSVSHCVLPSAEQTLPEMYLKDFVIFLCNIAPILTADIPDLYYELKSNKLKYALIFKEMCLNWLRSSHLLGIILPSFKDTEIISNILNDFQNINLEDIISSLVKIMSFTQRLQFIDHFYYNFEELENILDNDFSVTQIINWCQTIYSQKLTKDLKDVCLGWSKFFSIFLSHLLIEKSSSFAHVHLLFLWIEHLLYTNCILMDFKKFTMSTFEVYQREQFSENKTFQIQEIDYNYNITNLTSENPQISYQVIPGDCYYGYQDLATQDNTKECWNLL